MADFGLTDRYCVIYNRGERYFGKSEAELHDLIGRTDLLLNISGHLPADCPLASIPRRAYVDVDPGFTQIWAQQRDIGLARHDLFFTVGQNVGTNSFRILSDGIDWNPMLPPANLDEWPCRIDERCTRFSTIADWRCSQEAVCGEEYYAGKRKEFLRFLQLPRDSEQRIELALCISPEDCEDIELLVGNEWGILDPYLYAADPMSYREFIQTCRAEFSVAKHGYVKSNSGWISDRTACFLASGKPALVQSTGFESHIPTGRGLLTFRTIDEAMAGLREINANYLDHCRAARRLAEEYFDSSIVLSNVLDICGLTWSGAEVASVHPAAARTSA